MNEILKFKGMFKLEFDNTKHPHIKSISILQLMCSTRHVCLNVYLYNGQCIEISFMYANNAVECTTIYNVITICGFYIETTNITKSGIMSQDDILSTINNHIDKSANLIMDECE